MTFEDMMAMKRLGETAVSADGKWLAYSVTTVDLKKNTKTPELWLQAIAGGEPFKPAGAELGDSNPQFSSDGKRILFISGREGGQQVWVEDFDTVTGAASNLKKLTSIVTEADSPKWSPDGRSVVFLSSVYPDCPAITTADFDSGNKCNADRDKALADSKVKAQIWTHLLYRHWDHYTGDKRSHLFLVSVDSGAMRDLNPNDPRDVPPFSLDDSSCGCNFSPDSKELAFTENLDPEPATSISASIFTLDLTDPAAKPVKVSTSAGGNFNPAYSPDGKYLAWRSEARAGYESDRFRLILWDRENKTAQDILSTAVVFTPGPKPAHFERWVDEFVWSQDSKIIYFISGEAGESPIQSISLEPVPHDVEMALHRDAADQHPVQHRQLDRYGKIRGNWSDIHGILDNGRFRFIGSLMRVDMPPEVSLGDPLQINDSSQTAIVTFGNPSSVQNTTQASYEPTLVTHLNDVLLAQLDLPKMESFWFTASDGTKVQAFIIRPPGFDPAKKYPLKFLIHGGPQGRGANHGATVGTRSCLPPTATSS